MIRLALSPFAAIDSLPDGGTRVRTVVPWSRSRDRDQGGPDLTRVGGVMQEVGVA